MSIRLLIVEDARDVAAGIAFGARMAWPGCQTVIAASGREALEAFEREAPDLVVLDVTLPPPDGLEVLRRLRERSPVPVLMLSARGDTLDKVRALNVGADDYVTKPFDPLELITRLQALLRRSRWEVGAGRPVVTGEKVVAIRPARRHTDRLRTDELFLADDLTVDFTKREVYVRGQVVRLTPSEYRLLEALVRRAGTVLSHQELLEQVWGGEYVGDVNSLKVFVRRLRQKLGDDPKRPRYVQNEWGLGYRFPLPPDDGRS